VFVFLSVDLTTFLVDTEFPDSHAIAPRQSFSNWAVALNGQTAEKLSPQFAPRLHFANPSGARNGKKCCRNDRTDDFFRNLLCSVRGAPFLR
jgi:hypothetical protein